jgi:hypothetical protein
MRILIDPPDKDRRPDSEDPRVVVRGDPTKDGYEGEGGWAVPRHPKENYAVVVRQWRQQSPHYAHKKDASDGPDTNPSSGAIL